MSTRKIILYLLASAIVIILGALAGWYFFLRGETQATSATDTGRGFSQAAPFGAEIGSTYQNMVSGVMI